MTKDKLIDVEAGVKNPFTPTVLEIMKGEHKFEELDELDFIKHVNKVDIFCVYKQKYAIF